MHASFETTTERPTLRFERRLEHPVDAVWRAITEPSELEHWFPCAVAGEFRLGGRLSFDFHADGVDSITGEVTAIDPPRRLSFTWGDDQLHFELEPLDAGERPATRLRFTVELDTRDKAARDAAGWHVCLDRLDRQLAAGAATASTNQLTDEWRGHYDEYRRRGFPADAPLPT